MLRGGFFVLTYHIIFFVLSMTLVTLLEGYGTEMFAYSFYGNILYIVVGSVFNYLLYLLLMMFRLKSYIIHFLLCLFFVNGISFFFEKRFISLDIFSMEYKNMEVIIITHLIMMISYILSVGLIQKIDKEKKWW